MFSQLSALNAARTSWRIKVRLTRIWPSVSSKSDSKNSLKGYNLILLDDDNTHVQAFVYADNWKPIAKDMIEGGLYVISNFYTREATGSLRPTSSKFIINFSSSTTIEKLSEDDFMIPAHKFEFVDLADLFRIASSYEDAENPAFATDIIGVLEDFENVKKINTIFGERDIVKFRITDGRYSHKVSVWGKLAVAIHEAYEKIAERPIIAIVSSTKLKTFRSSVQINTLPSSKIYLNLDNDCVNAMRIRLAEEGYTPPEITADSGIQSPEPIVIEIITLRDLSTKTSMAHANMNFMVKVTVSSVDEAQKWWYNSCNDCEGEVYKIEGKLNCSKCSKLIPISQKRFKIFAIATDEADQFNFILSDRAARRIIGQTAEHLYYVHVQSKENTEFPTKIMDIAGKEYTFNVIISDDNVLIESRIFHVSDAYPIITSSSSFSNGTPSSLPSSSYAENVIDVDKNVDTPESAKSVSKKKIKTEK